MHFSQLPCSIPFSLSALPFRQGLTSLSLCFCLHYIKSIYTNQVGILHK
nr:MAG TPA: hypothetical protein [Caudoviricetes sp.]